jgi:hypothetical protein
MRNPGSSPNGDVRVAKGVLPQQFFPGTKTLLSGMSPGGDARCIPTRLSRWEKPDSRAKAPMSFDRSLRVHQELMELS